MLTKDAILNMFDEIDTHGAEWEPLQLFVSPRMHKRLFMVERFMSLFPEPKRKLRKVQMRRWFARRKMTRKHFEHVYDKELFATVLQVQHDGLHIISNTPIF